jgi:hypothetical protein
MDKSFHASQTWKLSGWITGIKHQGQDQAEKKTGEQAKKE